MSAENQVGKKKIDVMKVALAGLLHDIGKFWQRTSSDKPFSKGEKDYFNTYEHSLWSSSFIERFISDTEIEKMVREHHKENPDTLEGKILKLSDWLASGERRIEEALPQGAPKSARLENIFDNLFVSEKSETTSRDKTYFPLSTVGDYSKFFPLDRQGTSEHNDDETYDSLWQKFQNDLISLGYSNTSHLNLSYTTWLSLMRKYTSRIPSATSTLKGKYAPDISLYQHSKITSAISTCLAINFNNGTLSESDIEKILTVFPSLSSESNDSSKDNRSSENDLPMITTFLGGDVSGIQEYIYNIPTKGAAKQLKARSFLIQLLCDFVADYICEYFHLPPANIIYSSGGRFYILLPIIKDQESFNNEIRKISRKLLEYLKGEIHLIIATTEVKPQHFLLGGFKDIWQNITHTISAKKRNKYYLFVPLESSQNSDKDKDNLYELIFAPKKFSPLKGTAGAEDEPTPERADEIDMENIGKRLRNAKYIVRRKTDRVHKAENPAPLEFINSLGYNYEFYQDFAQIENLDNVKEIIFVNQLDLGNVAGKLKDKLGKISLSFKTYANHWPLIKNSKNSDEKSTHEHPVYFEHFAEGAKGTNKIGIFRADVDSLGNVFKKGLGEMNTLSRSAMLSNVLSEFFEGYVNHLAQQEEFEGFIGVIYSGGDDLFVVGAWDKVFEFALRLQDDFKKYTHNQLSISGGIVVVDATTPLRLTAKMAEEAENKGKAYTRPQYNNGTNAKEKTKDCIVLFNTPIGYEEKGELLEIKKNLLCIHKLSISDDKIPFGGIFHKLQSIFAVYLAQKRLREIRKTTYRVSTPQLIKEVVLDRWRWLLVYSLRKYLKEEDSEKESPNKQVMRVLLNNITDKLLKSDITPKRTYKIEDKIGAILRWVELLTREKETE